MFQGQLLLKEILDLFQNERLMEPLSKLETLVNVKIFISHGFGGVTISSILYTNDKTITLEVLGVTQKSVIW